MYDIIAVVIVTYFCQFGYVSSQGMCLCLYIWLWMYCVYVFDPEIYMWYVDKIYGYFVWNISYDYVWGYILILKLRINRIKIYYIFEIHLQYI